MSQVVIKRRALSPARKRLVELMQEVNYGKIEGLHVHNGEPVFSPPPTVLRQYKFGKDNGSHESRGSHNFTLKSRVVQLFEAFDRERMLVIQELVISNGLPTQMTAMRTVRS